MSENITCPNCLTNFEAGVNNKHRRNCASCGNNIGRHDKWFFNGEGKVQHRHCEAPDKYFIEQTNKNPGNGSTIDTEKES